MRERKNVRCSREIELARRTQQSYMTQIRVLRVTDKKTAFSAVPVLKVDSEWWNSAGSIAFVMQYVLIYKEDLDKIKS